MIRKGIGFYIAEGWAEVLNYPLPIYKQFLTNPHLVNGIEGG
jgi:hypothetical protein